MRNNKHYPITFSFVTDHPELLPKIFQKYAPHKGAFIGVTELEGCFLCDSPGELYSSLEIGEKLSLSPDKDSKSPMPALTAVRADGTAVGTLPYSAAIVPNTLRNRGVDVWCHVEAKNFNAGMFAVAVSIYCEKY